MAFDFELGRAARALEFCASPAFVFAFRSALLQVLGVTFGDSEYSPCFTGKHSGSVYHSYLPLVSQPFVLGVGLHAFVFLVVAILGSLAFAVLERAGRRAEARAETRARQLLHTGFGGFGERDRDARRRAFGVDGGGFGDRFPRASGLSHQIVFPPPSSQSLISTFLNVLPAAVNVDVLARCSSAARAPPMSSPYGPTVILPVPSLALAVSSPSLASAGFFSFFVSADRARRERGERLVGAAVRAVFVGRRDAEVVSRVDSEAPSEADTPRDCAPTRARACTTRYCRTRSSCRIRTCTWSRSVHWG